MGLSNILNTFEFNLTEKDDVLTALETSTLILDQIIIDLNQILQIHGSISENSEQVVFQSLVDEITLSLANLIAQENVTIKTNFSAAGKTFTIKSYMYSIFYNLILNGIMYRQTGVEPLVSISTRAKEDGLEILFKDNGNGIDEKNIKNLFGLYKRFDTSVEGKGIGLFLVKMQVENLGGKISVQSKVGIGTIFKLEFPNQ